MTFALVGNQNAGKTTIFNELTNMNQHVGNFPGVTVEYTTGKSTEDGNCKIVDLPGLYSLNTYTSEEEVSKEFILNENVDCVINVVDATNLNRNLYLTMQLVDLKIPMVIALNTMNKKSNIDIKRLSDLLAIPVIKITDVNKKETHKLISESIKMSRYKRKKQERKQENEQEIIKRYNIIEQICRNVSFKNNKIKTSIIEKILTSKTLGIPIFFLIMFTIFYITFNIIGEYGTEIINNLITVFTNHIDSFLEANNINFIIKSLITDGAINGIGTVISFLPIVLTLYFFLSILEDSGYMTSIAFIMDKPLRKFGISGKSMVPILLGFGCSVPAVLSIRTLPSEKEKKKTLQLIPFASCSAKIPIYAIFVEVFFEKYRAIAMMVIYILGIILGIINLKLRNLKSSIDETTFIMEMPNYRIPSLKNTMHLMWNKTSEFIEKAFSIIFVSTIFIWFLKNFDMNLNLVKEENSMLAVISQKISPIFAPLGLNDWRIVAAIITGISAKEAVISTLSIFSTNSIYEIVEKLFTPASAMSFIIFILLYTPCIVALSIIKKEFNTKTMVKLALNQFIIAYIISFISYKLSNLFLYFF